MALITGSPYGNTVSSESIYPTNAPYIYFQDVTPGAMFAPDGDGYYWQLSGTSAYPVYAFECVEGVSFTEGRTLNDVICDNVGVVSTTEARDYVEFQLSVKSLFPLSNLARIMNLSAATETAPMEKVGIGVINNNQYWQVWTPHVYDTAAADWFAIHLHRVKFVEAWTLEMPYGEAWSVTGLRLRGYADTTKPQAQQFGVMLRADASVIV